MSDQQPIGTPEEQTVHREPAPSPTEHNAGMAGRPDECVGGSQ